jgi:hypothetical protein
VSKALPCLQCREQDNNKANCVFNHSLGAGKVLQALLQ